MRACLIVLTVVMSATPLAAQTFSPAPPPTREIGLSGPRFGITSLSDGVLARLHDRDIDVQPMISQFGWQFERQFYGKQGGVSVLNEWVVLLGGMDQGVPIPSL